MKYTRSCLFAGALVALGWLLGSPLCGSDDNPSPADLASGFAAPAEASRPWAYWWWVKGNVTEESITHDLEQMRQKGFTGLLMFDARGYHEDHLPPPPARMEFMSSEWRRLLQFGMREAARLGLQVSVNLSSCAGALRGPWLVGDDAPKTLVWATQEVEGGKPWDGKLPRGEWANSWDIAVLAVRHASGAAADNAAALPAEEVVDLSDRRAGEQLDWNVPAGRWTILRFAHTLMADREYDVDILDAQAVSRHFDRMCRTILSDAGPLAGKTLTHFYSVSWEGASPTWTRDFDQHFARLRGYSLRPYLPVLAGMTVHSREVSERFLRDYHKSLGECFHEHCYGTLKKLCHEVGLQWHSESGGPWDRKIPTFQHADQLAFLGQNDMPQGEFWYPERGFNRPVAMTANIYGRPLAAAEAFTHMQPHWSVYPAILKPCADAAFCDGINHLIWHTFTASPKEFGKPGIEYFAGSHINPNVTWFEQAGPFIAYLARCQFLLQQGKPVVDVCCYTGDRPYLHWGRGDKWSASPTLTLDRGYTYDLVNTPVLLERLSVADGRIVLPDGMSYSTLVLDLEDDAALPAVLRKVNELARAGATVVLGQRRPVRTPGLTDYPQGDEEVCRLADALWGPATSPDGARTVGQGRVLRGVALGEALSAPADFEDSTGKWLYRHRRSENADIYFVAGSGSAECTFRMSGKEPEIWDPVTGRTRDAVTYRPTDDGRTAVKMTLPESGSAFVVFRRPAEGGIWASLPPEIAAVEGRKENGAALQMWGKLPSPRSSELDPPGLSRTVGDGLPAAMPLTGPWQLQFDPTWGGPSAVTFERLIPWNEHPDEGIKYYSGTAAYRTAFELDATQVAGLVRLDMGQVKHVADVQLNGKPLGIVWTSPWIVDLTGAVVAGKNELSIQVTNLWVNRLIGDAKMPEEKRLTKTHARRPPGETGRHAHLKGYTADDPLAPSGLLGPVRIEFGQRIELPLP